MGVKWLRDHLEPVLGVPRGQRWQNSPEARAVLSQGVEDGVGDVGAARSTQGLQLVAAPADGDQPIICDLLPGKAQLAQPR